jgi:hypothetical protein
VSGWGRYPILTYRGWEDTHGFLVDGWLINASETYPDGWSVTHPASGRRLADFETKGPALRFTRALYGAGVKTDMTPEEIAAKGPAIRRVLRRIRKAVSE